MVDRAVIWAIVLGMTYFIMSVAVTVEDAALRGFVVAAIFLFMTTALSKPQ